MSETAPFVATHTLDGQPIAAREDKAGRAYYVDASNQRVATAGKSLVPVDAASSTPEPPVPQKPEPPTALRFEVFSVAVAAHRAPHGYCEWAGYCAKRCGPNEVEISIPAEGGGHDRYIIDLPETVAVTARHADS